VRLLLSYTLYLLAKIVFVSYLPVAIRVNFFHEVRVGVCFVVHHPNKRLALGELELSNIVYVEDVKGELGDKQGIVGTEVPDSYHKLLEVEGPRLVEVEDAKNSEGERERERERERDRRVSKGNRIESNRIESNRIESKIKSISVMKLPLALLLPLRESTRLETNELMELLHSDLRGVVKVNIYEELKKCKGLVIFKVQDTEGVRHVRHYFLVEVLLRTDAVFVAAA